MRVRAKANGNVLEVSDEQGENLIKTGIYEKVDENDQPVAGEPKPTKPAQKYERRDMRAKG